MRITGMKALTMSVVLGTAVALGACETGDKMVKKPVNCPTAKQDVAALQKERASVLREMGAGAQLIVPVASIIALIGGKWDQNARIAGGKYNEDIDAKIKEIKAACGV